MLKEAKLNLDLSTVDPDMIEYAKRMAETDRILAFMAFMPNTRRLVFVLNNIRPLKECGLDEGALLDAYIATQTNFSGRSPYLVRFLFKIADRKKLIEAGDPLPGEGPFTIYRGVAGREAARRIRGISWTGSLKSAIWFAKRYDLEKPAVFECTVHQSLILAYTEDREEFEFIWDIPRELKLKKVWPRAI
jgi:hypothetical protein